MRLIWGGNEIAFAEDRELFRQKMIALGIRQTEGSTAFSLEEAVDIAMRIGYPLMVRPSFIGRQGVHDDSYIRMLAIQYKIPYVTTMAAARATVDGIYALKKQEDQPKSLQEYHKLLGK